MNKILLGILGAILVTIITLLLVIRKATNVSLPTIKFAPGCPGAIRPGLDPQIYNALDKVTLFIRDMHRDVRVCNQVMDEDTAAQRYIAYLSVLVDVSMREMSLSAIHGYDLALLMKQRMLVEYAAKAWYFHRHRDYALFMTTINEAENVVKKFKHAAADAETIKEKQADTDVKKQKFARVANLSAKGLDVVIKECGTGDDYAWLYGGPSALLHGDPEGMRIVLDVNDEGVMRIVTRIPDEQLNAIMVDVGRNTLLFCGAFVACFHPGNQELQDRLNELDRLFDKLLLEHAFGRDHLEETKLQDEHPNGTKA